MQVAEAQRAVDAAMSTASALDLPSEEGVILHNSNKLAIRLLPCDVFARVGQGGQEAARLEVELAQHLVEADSPVAMLEPRVPPRVHVRDGFAITLWTYYEALGRDVPPPAYARGLMQLHAGMRTVDAPTPHFSDRVAEALHLVTNRDRSPRLSDVDRDLLSRTLRSQTHAIAEAGAAEQLLHGEPHPGNVLLTEGGPVFVDLETCCRGPVEFDLAHVPDDVSDRYPGVDRALLRQCQVLVLAMVAAWRCDPTDQLPNGQEAKRALLHALHDGPPFPSPDVVMRRAGFP